MANYPVRKIKQNLATSSHALLPRHLCDDRERERETRPCLFQHREQGSESSDVESIEFSFVCDDGSRVSVSGRKQGHGYVSGMANTRPRNGKKETLKSQSREKRILHVRSRRRMFVLRCTYIHIFIQMAEAIRV
mgnify:CR=1 FL=1